MKLSIERKPLIIIGGIIIILLLLTPSFYFYNKYQTAQKMLKNPSEMTKLENKELIARIAEIIELPTGEEPEIRTVANKDEVKNQPFFQGAENGDKVLIYSNAKKAFLYRPSLNKIINVAPISVVSPSPSPISNNVTPIVTISIQPSPKPSPTVKLGAYKFYLLNGTTKVGLTKTYELQLLKALPESEVVDRDNAKKNDYKDSVLILVNRSKDNIKDQVAKTLSLALDSLPAGEELPEENVDFLIILGSDQNK